MTLRTLEELSDRLADDLSWRRKELSALKALIDSAANEAKRRDPLIRCGVALLYAHWEGFIRSAGGAYLEYVAVRRLRYDELGINFVALGVRQRLLEAARRDDPELQNALVMFLLKQLSERSNLPYKEGVDTKSNLSFDVLRRLMHALGLSVKGFETKQKLIDEKLLARRNSIAHGQYLPVGTSEYDELHTQVIGMIVLFRDTVESAATAAQYRAA